MHSFEINNNQLQFPVEILKPSDARTKSQKCNNEIGSEINGLLAKGAFKYVERIPLPKHTISWHEDLYYRSNNPEQKQKDIKLYSSNKDIKIKKRNL